MANVLRIATTLAIVAVAIATAAQGASTDRTVSANSVKVLAAGGVSPQRIGFLERSSSEPCGVVRVWLLSPGTVPRVSARCRDQRTRLYGLAVAGESVVWASRSADGQGVVWFATGSPLTDRYTAPRVIARASGRAPEFVIADGDVAAVASGRRVIRGSYSWLLRSRAVRLAASGPYVAVQEEDGPVSVFLEGSAPNDPMPASQFEYPAGAVDALKIHASTLLVLRGRRLDVRGVYRPSIIATFTLPRARSYGDDHCGRLTCPTAALRLADLQGDLVVYIAGSTIHVLRLSDGRDVAVRRGLRGMIHAELQATGLSYSADDGVHFIPRSEISEALEPS